MKKLLETTRPADRPAGDTKAPAWKNTAALHETKDIIGRSPSASPSTTSPTPYNPNKQ